MSGFAKALGYPEMSLGTLMFECFLRTLFTRTCLRHQHDNSRGDLEIHRSLKAGRSILKSRLSSLVFAWHLMLQLVECKFQQPE